MRQSTLLKIRESTPVPVERLADEMEGLPPVITFIWQFPGLVQRSNGPEAEGTENLLVPRTIGRMKKSSNGSPLHPGEFRWTIKKAILTEDERDKILDADGAAATSGKI